MQNVDMMEILQWPVGSGNRESFSWKAVQLPLRNFVLTSCGDD